MARRHWERCDDRVNGGEVIFKNDLTLGPQDSTTLNVDISLTFYTALSMRMHKTVMGEDTASQGSNRDRDRLALIESVKYDGDTAGSNTMGAVMIEDTVFRGGSRDINIHSSAVVAILGLSASFLWTAQGSCTLEMKKGKFIGTFWSIFNLGSAVGVSDAAGRNRKSTANVVDNGTYIEFIVLTLIRVLIPGESRQDDSFRWNKCYGALTPLLEDRNYRSIRDAED
ncbi:uncharacterized protein ARMOST_08645 [Armillaria ostoyae]|uniref:Uncharacterized protein n=1 Tax=Armillaria ostoyae TaxID=47428 RepID=A0A284R9A4_ARMOS|nr:uncharacterized protein ARMOST_08645 [Armillaria ostoyae]